MQWAVSAAVVNVVTVCHQAAAVLRSGLWTDYDVERLTAQLRRRRLPASTDAPFPQQHPLHQSPAEREFTALLLDNGH